MIQNFIAGIETGVWEPLYNQLLLILIFWVVVTISVIIDLYMGVSCSRMAGKKVQSNKLRKSVHKINKYLILLLVGFLFDMVLSILPFWSIPIASLIFTVSIMGIEAKSVIENFNLKKDLVKSVVDLTAKIVACDSLPKAMDIIKELSQVSLAGKNMEDQEVD